MHVMAQRQGTSGMHAERWKRFGLVASMVWVIVGGLLASRNETWIAAWRFYCSVAADPACSNATMFVVVHWNAIAGAVVIPLVLAWLVAWGLIVLTVLTRRIRRSGHDG
jgi:hypothetical protein